MAYILNRFDTSGLKTVRIDISNPEAKKAVKKVTEFLKENAEEFQLEPGETFKSVAENLVRDVIGGERFIVSSISIHEIIVSLVLKNLQAMGEDESYTYSPSL